MYIHVYVCTCMTVVPAAHYEQTASFCSILYWLLLHVTNTSVVPQRTLSWPMPVTSLQYEKRQVGPGVGIANDCRRVYDNKWMDNKVLLVLWIGLDWPISVVCCSVLQYVAVCCIVLQFCSVLQSVVVKEGGSKNIFPCAALWYWIVASSWSFKSTNHWHGTRQLFSRVQEPYRSCTSFEKNLPHLGPGKIWVYFL